MTRSRATGRVLVATLVAAGLAGSGAALAQHAQGEALAEKLIAAAGGMAAWEGLRDMSFTLAIVPFTPQGEPAGARVSLYYLKRPGRARVETLTGQGLQVQGFDGDTPWVTIGGTRETDPEALRRAHFQAVNWWYWMGIPFKLKDPGVVLRHAGARPFRGTSVEVLEATFQEGVGHTSDRYTYYIDPESHRIVFVEFLLQGGVWPGVGGPTPARSDWLDYQSVGPFTRHTRRIFYADAELTARRVVLFFGDFRINPGLPDSLFEAP